MPTRPDKSSCYIQDPFQFGTGLERYTETQSRRSRITIRFELVLPKCCQKSIIKSHPIYNLVLYVNIKCFDKSPNMTTLA